MRRLLAVLTAGAAAFGVGLAPAQAITGNFRPDFEHDYVGLIVFYDAMGTPSHRCSGSLLTDTVFLTAGHCVTLDDEGTLAASARVYFEQDVDAVATYPTSGGVEAHELYDYGYRGLDELPQSRDLGLVILDEPVTNVYPRITEYASLAASGTLDSYGTGIDTQVDLSGYGDLPSRDRLRSRCAHDLHQPATRRRETSRGSARGRPAGSRAGARLGARTATGGAAGSATRRGSQRRALGGSPESTAPSELTEPTIVTSCGASISVSASARD